MTCMPYPIVPYCCIPPLLIEALALHPGLKVREASPMGYFGGYSEVHVEPQVGAFLERKKMGQGGYQSKIYKFFTHL